MKPNNNVCHICEAPFDFTTDGNGQLVVLHPITKCVKRIHIPTAECSVCEREIRLASDPVRKTVFWCSTECYEILKERKRLRDLATQRTYQRNRYRKPKPRQPFIPTERFCIECGDKFTPKSVHAMKQFLCGAKCHYARGNAAKKKKVA